MQWREFFFSYQFFAAAIPLSQINLVIFFFFRTLTVQNNVTIENGHRFALDVFTKIWCNYTGILLTLCKMMRNELLMKTLPGAAQWIYVLLVLHPHSGVIVEVEWENSGEKRERGETRVGRIRTNALDFNKDVSEQIAWPYINHAEALGDLPLLHWGPLELAVTK